MSLTTLRELFGHFAHRNRYVLIPLLLVIVLAGLLLALTSGLSVVAPLAYTLV